jgi:hypothetical protein
MEKCKHESTIALTENMRWCQRCGGIRADHPQIRKGDWLLPEREKSLWAEEQG